MHRRIFVRSTVHRYCMLFPTNYLATRICYWDFLFSPTRHVLPTFFCELFDKFKRRWTREWLFSTLSLMSVRSWKCMWMQGSRWPQCFSRSRGPLGNYMVLEMSCDAWKSYFTDGFFFFLFFWLVVSLEQICRMIFRTEIFTWTRCDCTRTNSCAKQKDKIRNN